MNRKNRILILTLLFTILTGANLKAQNMPTPYSMYGYGMLTDGASSMQNQMGGVGYAMHGSRQVNVMNPASYSQIDSLTFLFDMGVNMGFLWNKDKDSRDHTIGGGLTNITMQFPIGKYFGGSLGLIPYSSVGYSFGKDVNYGTRQNQGSGGINRLYGGFSGKFAGVSLGVNIAYSFGNIVNDIFSTPSSSGQTLFEHIMRVRDWDVNVGLMYTAKINMYETLTVGATYTPKKSIHGRSVATIQEITLDSKADTIGEMKMGGNYYTPQGIGAGISWTHQKASRLMIEADVAWQNWKDAKFSPMYSLKEPEKVLFEGMNFNNRLRLALGSEYTPQLRGNYARRITYRIGGFYTADYLSILGNDVREYGITAGAGLPAPGGKTVINVGLEWKHRQAHPDPLLTENYFNITLGVNFNELWFWQRKIK